MKKNTLIVATLSAFSFLAPSAHGAGLVVIQTDANGNFVPTNVGTGSWSGDGTVTSGITGSENEVTFVSGTSGGTFSPGNFAKRAGDPAVYINGDRDNTGISLNISISVTGNNASFDIGGLTRFSDPEGWGNFRISNMQNVESLSVNYSFGEPIAPMRGTDSSFPNAPYLVAMRQASGIGTYDASSTIANLTVDGSPYNAGSFPDVNFMTLGDATWNTSSAAGSVIGGETSPTFNGLLRLDLDGDGIVLTPTNSSVEDGIVQEIERTYATGMTWTITSNGDADNGNAFSNGSEFYFSFNGVQYPDTIPEPSVPLLVAFGLFGILGFRKRV